MKIADSKSHEAPTLKCQTCQSRQGSLCKFFQAEFASAWVLLGPEKGDVGTPEWVSNPTLWGRRRGSCSGVAAALVRSGADSMAGTWNPPLHLNCSFLDNLSLQDS